MSNAARRMAEELHHRTSRATDGYAARECLSNPRFTALVTPQHANGVRDLVRACALGSGDLPAPQAARLTMALRLSDEVIRASISHPQSAPLTGP